MTAQAYIADGARQEERTRWLGFAGAAVGLGIAVGVLVGGILGVGGLLIPALAASALALGNAVFGFFFVKDFRPAAPVQTGQPGQRFAKIDPLGGLRMVLRDPRLRPLLLTLAALNLSFIGLPVTFPLFSQARFGWSPADNGPFFAFIGACAILAQGFLIRRLAPRVGESRLAAIGAATAAAMFSLVVFARSGWMLYPIMGVLAIATGLAIPSLTSLLAHRSPGAADRRHHGSRAGDAELLHDRRTRHGRDRSPGIWPFGALRNGRRLRARGPAADAPRAGMSARFGLCAVMRAGIMRAWTTSRASVDSIVPHW